MSQNSDVGEIINKIPNAKLYENNPKLLQMLYSQITPPKSDLKTVTEGDRVENVEVLIGGLLSERPVILCPVCNSGLKAEEGQTVPCNSSKCGGNQVVAVKSMGYKFMAGSPDVEVVLDVAPFRKIVTDPQQMLAKVVKVTGKVDNFKRKDGLKVINITKLEVIRDLREGTQAPETQKQSSTTTEPANEPDEPAPKLPTEKIAPLKGWIAVMRKSKPNGIPEGTVKSYIETVLKVKWEDALPLLKTIDTPEGKLYSFKE